MSVRLLRDEILSLGSETLTYWTEGEEMLDQIRKLGSVSRIMVIVAGILASLVIPSAASADTLIDGHAKGQTIALGNGTFLIVGIYRDASGALGIYHGTYREVTTGYTSCRSTGIGGFHCGEPMFPNRCNLISGVVTLRSQGKSVTLNIGSAGLAPPASRIVSGVCLREGDTATRDTYLMLTNRTDNWPATVEEFSRGYGILAYAIGSLVGTSTPLAPRSPVYIDELTLHLGLFTGFPG
jgi:hypothetical protein